MSNQTIKCLLLIWQGVPQPTADTARKKCFFRSFLEAPRHAPGCTNFIGSITIKKKTSLESVDPKLSLKSSRRFR